MYHKIPCPDCNQPIHIETTSMLSGEKFACPNCNLRIGLDFGSVPTVRDAYQKYDQMKAQMKSK